MTGSGVFAVSLTLWHHESLVSKDERFALTLRHDIDIIIAHGERSVCSACEHIVTDRTGRRSLWNIHTSARNTFQNQSFTSCRREDLLSYEPLLTEFPHEVSLDGKVGEIESRRTGEGADTICREHSRCSTIQCEVLVLRARRCEPHIARIAPHISIRLAHHGIGQGPVIHFHRVVSEFISRCGIDGVPIRQCNCSVGNRRSIAIVNDITRQYRGGKFSEHSLHSHVSIHLQ